MRFLFDRDDHDDWPVLGPFVAAGLGFAIPEIGVSEDLSRLRNRP